MATPTFARVCAVMTSMDLNYSRDEERGACKLYFDGTLVVVTTSAATVVVHAYIKTKCAAEHRFALCQLLALWNYELQYGNWELDCNDGETRFKTAIPFEGEIALKDVFSAQLSVGLKEVERREPQLQYFHTHGRLPREGSVGSDDESAASAQQQQQQQQQHQPREQPRQDAPPPPREAAVLEPEIFSAVRNDEVDALRALLAEGSDEVNSTMGRGLSPLTVACFRGNLEIVRLLLDHGANVDHVTEVGDSALSLAVFKKWNEIALLLLERGANAHRADQYGDTALLDAARWNMVDVVRALLARGVDVNHRNQKGDTALKRARTAGFSDLVQLLRENGAEE